MFSMDLQKWDLDVRGVKMTKPPTSFQFQKFISEERITTLN